MAFQQNGQIEAATRQVRVATQAAFVVCQLLFELLALLFGQFTLGNIGQCV
ncbi:hypothetical protein D3C78_1861480 [compost metagenome]